MVNAQKWEHYGTVLVGIGKKKNTPKMMRMVERRMNPERRVRI